MTQQRERMVVEVALGTVIECSCGVVVSVSGGGHKRDYETGSVHLHVVPAGGSGERER